MTIQVLTEVEFDEFVVGGQTVLILFGAPWCGPCKNQKPIIEELADELRGKVVVGYVNIDLAVVLVSRLGIMSVPTIIIYKDGEETGRLVGFQQKSDLMSYVS